MTGATYLASEDSALLRRALEGRSGRRCLEIGAGNCGNLLRLSEKFGTAVGTDLVRPSMADWKGAKADFVQADGASCLRTGAFDLVAFNPPYVAADVEDVAVEGGPGLEVPKKMLREALRTVRQDGEIVFLLNDEADRREFEDICADAGFGLREVAAERTFFERLAVYSARAMQRTPSA